MNTKDFIEKYEVWEASSLINELEPEVEAGQALGWYLWLSFDQIEDKESISGRSETQLIKNQDKTV